MNRQISFCIPSVLSGNYNFPSRSVVFFFWGEALDVDVLSCCAFWGRRKEVKRKGKTNGEHVNDNWKVGMGAEETGSRR